MYFLRSLLFCALVSTVNIHGAMPVETVSADELDVASQFLKVLLANPRFGTAFDRVVEFHIDRGSIGQLEESLCRIAGLSVDPGTDKPEAFGPIESLPVPASTDAGSASLVAGMLRLKHSEFTVAIVALQSASGMRPDDPVAHWYLAWALAAVGRTDEAVTEFERAIACRPQKADLIEISRELARTHQHSQNPAAALAAWERLEGLFPGDLRVRQQIAVALADEGRWQDALSRFELLARDTTDLEQRVQANLSASDLLLQLSRPDDAIRLLESQLSHLDADSWLFKEIRRRIEGVFRSRDDLAGLSNYYDAWIQSHPEDVDAMGRHARVLSLRNQSESAAEWYSRALTLAPSSISLRESLIEQLVRDRKPSEAIAQYELMAQHDAGNIDHVEDWGQLYLSRSDLTPEDRLAGAAAVWERLLIDREEDAATLSRVAGLMRRAEMTERAIALYRKAIEQAPDEPQHREYLGEYLQKLQRYDEALAVWTAIAEGDRRTKANLVRLAEVLHRFGVIQPALEAMGAACALDADLSDRRLFAEMLREAAEQIASNLPIGTQGSQRREQLIAEALNQLTLAEEQAETPDEQQQIVGERIKTLIVAGQLEEQTKLLADELQSQKPGFSATDIANRWRTLALYQSAAEKMPEATTSALKVVELEPQSTAGWAMLADFYERTGRLGDAADAMRKLASLDRRGISETLKKIARLEVRLGRFDQALQAGREVIRATPGSPEAYQFYADLCFEVGKPVDAMDALRNAVRVNPGDEASLRGLAGTLADEFHTAEATDLYWRAFEKASDLESQTSIVVALSKLYLRTNQFEKLIERLDLRSRELNLSREMNRCIATAYREAGDFLKARESLERLLLDDTQNVSVLKELVSLAEREHNLAEAEDYQRRVVGVTGSEPEQRRLLQILKQSGSTEQVESLLLRLAGAQTNRADILREADALFESGNEILATDLCRKLLLEDPHDWEAMIRLAEYFWLNDERSDARRMYRQIIELPLDFELPASAASGSSVAAASTHGEITLTRILAWNEASDMSPRLTFGAALLAACDALLLDVDGPTTEDSARVFSPAMRDRHGMRIAACLAVRYADGHGRWTTDTRGKLIRFLRETPGDFSVAMQIFAVCGQLKSGDWTDDHEAESTEAREFVLRVLPDIILRTPEWLTNRESDLPYLLASAMEDDGESTNSLRSVLLTTISKSPSMRSCVAVLNIAISIGDSQLVLQALSAIHVQATDNSTDAAEVDSIIDELSTSDTVEELFQFDDPEIVLSLLSIVSRRTPSGVTSDWIGIREFGSAPLRMMRLSLEAIVSLDAATAFHHWIDSRPFRGLPNEVLRKALVQSEMLLQLNDPEQALFFLICAAEAAPEDEHLRLTVAESAYRNGNLEDSLLLLQSMSPADPARVRDQTRLLLQISMKHGRAELAQSAAGKLFGLPLSTDEQLELIPILSKLGMLDKVSAIEARLGRESETRQSILGRKLQTYIAQGKDDLAGEAAWELLELASDGSLFSGRRPSDDRDDGGDRLQAIKALGRLNRLQPIIDRYEDMLAAAPDSAELLEILCEFHEAAEQWTQLTDKRDRIALLSRKAPPSLKARAVELERSGDVSGACDIYLQILRSDPEAFASEMETYLQSFERAGRLQGFLSAITEAGIDRFEDQVQTIVSAASLVKKSDPDSQVATDAIRSCLSGLSNGTPPPQKILLLLSKRPELIGEDELLEFVVQSTIFHSSYKFENGIVENSTRRAMEILQGFHKPESLAAVEKAVTENLQRHPEQRNSRIIYVYLQARLGKSDSARRIVRDMMADDNGYEFDSNLEHALAMLEGDWTEERIGLLERVLNPTIAQRGRRTPEEATVHSLASLYEQVGRKSSARRLLLWDVDRSGEFANSGPGLSQPDVRRVLAAAERVQHSGYPIEAVRVLQSLTAYDVEEFADDLGEDKAIAFKSRFSASDRWARQQITSEKLVEWFAMAVAEASFLSSDTGRKSYGVEMADAQVLNVDLLLELKGTTNAKTRDESELRNLGLHSVLLSAIAKNSFDEVELRGRLNELITQLLAQERPDRKLLTVAAAFALRTGSKKQLAVILERIQKDDELVPVVELDGVQTQSDATSASDGRRRIPDALRSQEDLALVVIAGLLAGDRSQSAVIDSFLFRSAVAAHESGNRMVRIAGLNECSRIAANAALQELARQFERDAAAAISEQFQSNSMGTAGKIDIGHEIRTRLLKQP